MGSVEGSRPLRLPTANSTKAGAEASSTSGRSAPERVAPASSAVHSAQERGPRNSLTVWSQRSYVAVDMYMGPMATTSLHGVCGCCLCLPVGHMERRRTSVEVRRQHKQFLVFKTSSSRRIHSCQVQIIRACHLRSADNLRIAGSWSIQVVKQPSAAKLSIAFEKHPVVTKFRTSCL